MATEVETKWFPLQTDQTEPGPLRIPWCVAEKAYSVYVHRYGKGQSLERLAQRGGFGWGEMDMFYPAWREEVDVVNRLVADLKAAKDKIEALDKWRVALESLTAQGSEFHNDLERCVAYVRERYAEGHKAKGDRVKLQRQLDAFESLDADDVRDTEARRR